MCFFLVVFPSSKVSVSLSMMCWGCTRRVRVWELSFGLPSSACLPSHPSSEGLLIKKGLNCSVGAQLVNPCTFPRCFTQKPLQLAQSSPAASFPLHQSHSAAHRPLPVPSAVPHVRNDPHFYKFKRFNKTLSKIQQRLNRENIIVLGAEDFFPPKEKKKSKGYFCAHPHNGGFTF